jgi:hypothetical protein
MTTKERSTETQRELRAMYRIARALLVPLSEIGEKAPPFWKSIRTAEQARRSGSPADRLASRAGRL